LNRLIRCVCGKKIGPDPRNFNQRVSLGRNDLLIRTFPNEITYSVLFYDESRSQILISYNQSETSEPLPTAHNLSPGSLHK
ncbi:hypothetical protein, partial [Klebsiella pneumoniae]|uniref:hypothetical protein n=1 Tax=Klebsiella pneumoniae TaxID=573 RepID=UPI001FB71FBD|nr:hypothetical protein [Klebsiella pneumoniae]